jgi:hypothetical protein
MSDLPPPAQSLRTALSVHALIAVAILVVVAVSGGGAAKALGIAALYCVLVGGWSWFRIWRGSRKQRTSSSAEEHR